MYGLDAVTVWICRLTSKRIPIINIPDNSVHGANMGPIWDRKGPGGPHVGPINLDIWDSTVVRPTFRTPHAMNTGWRQIDIHGCYLTVKIRFGPICASKNNWGIWWHDTRTSRLRDVKGQLWWRHNDKVGLCVQGIRQCVRNKKSVWITVSNDFCHSWGDSAMILTCEFVTYENYCRIASPVTKKSVFIVTHTLFYTSSQCVSIFPEDGLYCNGAKELSLLNVSTYAPLE